LSKEEQNIDKLIKDKLSDRDFGTPPQSFIDDLNKRLDHAPRNYIGFYLFTLLTSLLLCTFLLLLFIPTEFNTSIKKQGNIALKAKTHLTNNKEAIVSKKHKSTLNAAHKTNDKTRNNIDFTAESKKEKSNFIAAESTQGALNQKHSENINKGKSKLNSSEINLKRSNTQNESNPDGGKTEVKPLEEQTKTPKFSKLVNRGNKDDYKMITANEFQIIDEKINKWEFFTFESATPILKPKPDLVNAKKSEPEPNKKLSYEVQLYAGAGFDQARINNALSNEYTTKLNAQSKNKISPIIGANFNIIYQDLVFGTGLTFAQQREDNDFSVKSFYMSDSVYIAYYDSTVIYDSLNNPIGTNIVPVYDTTQVTNEQVKQEKIEQLYTWLQIPINFGYRFRLNKWSITPSLGVNFAIGIRNKAMKYPNQNFEQLNEYSAMKWHMNILGNIEVRRKINQWHVFARGSYNFGITPVLKSNLFQRKYNGINCVMGVGYSF
jgi:hypothetical protein